MTIGAPPLLLEGEGALLFSWNKKGGEEGGMKLLVKEGEKKREGEREEREPLG